MEPLGRKSPLEIMQITINEYKEILNYRLQQVIGSQINFDNFQRCCELLEWTETVDRPGWILNHFYLGEDGNYYIGNSAHYDSYEIATRPWPDLVAEINTLIQVFHNFPNGLQTAPLKHPGRSWRVLNPLAWLLRTPGFVLWLLRLELPKTWRKRPISLGEVLVSCLIYSIGFGLAVLLVHLDWLPGIG